MKKWYLSKTVWINLIALIGMGLETTTGKEILSAEYQGVILTVINLILRFITSKGITFKDVADVIKPDAGFSPQEPQKVDPAPITPAAPEIQPAAQTTAPDATPTAAPTIPGSQA